ncbi:MAG: FAD-dependent oxidoreductase, partial [bacterium]|nr:FAD-dependent oxidoreductase [bacterium]
FLKTAQATVATLDDGSKVECDAVLAAVGRVPNLDGLGLEAAGVTGDKRGIRVNDRCRTSQRHIYASGDVAGRFQFTHFAEHMSKIAISNAILKAPLKLDSRHITWCTYTDPELAHVGASEEELRKTGRRHKVHRFPYSELDRAITETNTTGLIKVLATGSGRILGVSILGAHAGELIAEYALAMKNGLKLRHISDTIHPYPTYMLGNRRAADLWYMEKRSIALLRWLQRLFGYRGELRDIPG